MATLLIKGLKEPVKERLKQQAEIHHRSMNQEVLMILEEALTLRQVSEFVASYQIKEPMSADEIADMVRQDRDRGH